MGLLSAMKVLSTVSFLVAITAVEAQKSPGYLWTATGGGWRSMVANSAYAQVFSNIGLLDNIDIVGTTSGSSWFSSQFFFSENYYRAVVDGTPESLGNFTRSWFEAYASTQADVGTSCGSLQELCDLASKLPPTNPLSDFAKLIPLMVYFDFSWPNLMFAMFNATSASYGDTSLVDVDATNANKLNVVEGMDVCFHTSLAPNMRSKEDNTVSFLLESPGGVTAAWTVPLPVDWCVGGVLGEGWNGKVPSSASVYPAPGSWPETSSMLKDFPMYPPTPSTSSLFAQPAGNASGTISMNEAFGGVPTAVQISTASSSTMGYLSEELMSVFAQYFSLITAGIEAESSLPENEKIVLLGEMEKIEGLFWNTGIMANLATCSAWTESDPKDMPGCQGSDYWFYDGGYTDGPSVANVLGRYQQEHGADNEIKLIISNNDFETNDNDNVLGYFSTPWNQGIDPGDFIWPPGVGSGPDNNPEQSVQIFEEFFDADSFNATFEQVTGTDLSIAFVNATTVGNPAFGVIAGQKVSLAIINLNSDIPTFIVTEEVISGYTPKMVELAETIAGSQNLADKMEAFASLSGPTPEETSSAARVSVFAFLGMSPILLLSVFLGI
jgi:hypothetical protein